MTSPDQPNSETAPITLRDGRTVTVRRIRPDDVERLQRFHEHLSRRSIYFRFFGALPHLPDAQARRFANVDYVDRWALVALDPDDSNEFVGVVRFDRGADPDEGELAAVVADRFQGQGLGRHLLLRLIEAARERGLRRLFALVLTDNLRTIGLLKRLGYPFREDLRGDTDCIILEIDAPVAAS